LCAREQGAVPKLPGRDVRTEEKKMTATTPGAQKPQPEGNVSRKRVLLLADLTPAWAAAIRALQHAWARVEFDVVTPPVGPGDLAARIRSDAAEAVVVVVDLGADPIHSMSMVTACRQETPWVPVVVVAANPSQELVRRIRLAGVFYLALDPVEAEEMRNVLDSAFAALARRRSHTSACRDRQRVLIIDDDADFVASTTALLESQGYAVTKAASGREGLARLKDEPPDLVVLDVMMEDDWAGYSVNQEVKFGNRFEGLRHVPILMVSSIPIDPATRFSRAGEVEMITPDAYLTKPLDISKFLAAVRVLLGEQKAQEVS
jgi:CheY-like chemotaxis protein